MWKRARYPREPPTLAYADLVVESVNFAVRRTVATRSQRFHGFLGPPPKNPLIECLHIGWHKIFAWQHKSAPSVQLDGRSVTRAEESVHDGTCHALCEPDVNLAATPA